MPRQLYKFYEVEHSQHGHVLNCFVVRRAFDDRRRRRSAAEPRWRSPSHDVYVCVWVGGCVGVWGHGRLCVCVCMCMCVCVWVSMIKRKPTQTHSAVDVDIVSTKPVDFGFKRSKTRGTGSSFRTAGNQLPPSKWKWLLSFTFTKITLIVLNCKIA